MLSAAVPGDLIGSGAFFDCLAESSNGKIADVLGDSLEPEAAGSDKRRVAIKFVGTARALEAVRSDE